MNRIEKWSASSIKQYLSDIFGHNRLDCRSIKKACEIVAKRHSLCPEDLFHFLIENEPVQGMYLHSYGFHTRAGREIARQLEEEYNEALDN